VRLAPKNFAFIEYEDEFKAGNALSSLNDTQIGGAVLRLSYAKK
jgi:RNA recognition motif-containing protein